MFNKVDDYNRITIVTYPDGNIKHKAKCSFDFDNGAREVERYAKESEKFKMTSLKAQSDTTENDTLSDDTLNITFEVADHTYTFVSASGFINIAYAKLLAQMTREELDKLTTAFQDREGTEYPKMLEFQDWINEIVGDKAEDIDFKAHIHIHDSYTQEHINAIKYIINSMSDCVEDKGNELVVASADPDLKNAIIDLGMSTYFDIDIEE